MKSLLFTVLLLSLSVFCLGASSKSQGHRVEGTRARRNVTEIREFHRQQRAAKAHKLYVPKWPKESLITYINIGEWKQVFPVALETGVEAAFVLDVSYEEQTDGQVTYDPSNSSGVDAGSFRSSTGGHMVWGEAYTDVVDYLSPMNLTFGSIQGDIPGWPLFVNISGVLGVQWKPSQKNKPVTPTSAPIFNIFAKLPDSPRYFVEWVHPNGDWWQIQFGGDLPDLCDSKPVATAPLSYVPITVGNSLSFQVDSFALGGDSTAGDAAKVDSGEPTIVLSGEAYNLVYYALYPIYDFDLSIYTTNCSNAKVFQDFVITINGVELHVPATNYVTDVGFGDGRCALAIDYFSDYTTPFVLGLPFQKSYCVKHDIDNSEISFLSALSQQ